MGNQVNSNTKTPFVFATLGATVGAIGGSKIGTKAAEKFISKNVLPVDDFIKAHTEDLTKVIKENFPEDKVAEKLKELPEIARKEYDVLVHNHKNITKKAFGFVGGLLLAATGYIVSKLIINKKQGPKLSSSLQEKQGLCGYDSTTARYATKRYTSTTARIPMAKSTTA